MADPAATVLGQSPRRLAASSAWSGKTLIVLYSYNRIWVESVLRIPFSEHKTMMGELKQIKSQSSQAGEAKKKKVLSNEFYKKKK